MQNNKPTFDSQEAIIEFLENVKNHYQQARMSYSSPSNWKKGLDDIRFAVKDHSTYFPFNTRKKSLDNEDLEAHEKTPLLSEQKKPKKDPRYTTNLDLTSELKLLANVLEAHDEKKAAKAQPGSFNFTEQDLSPDLLKALKNNHVLPLVMPDGNSISYKCLKASARNVLPQLLTQPRETVKSCKGDIVRLIESLILPYPDYYHPNPEKELDGNDIYLNVPLLSLLLTLKQRDGIFQKRVFDQLKQHKDDHKLWRKIHLGEIAVQIGMIYLLNKLCTAVDIAYISPFARIAPPALLLAINYTVARFEIVDPESLTWESAYFAVLVGTSMLFKDQFLAPGNEQNLEPSFVAHMLRGLMWISLYNAAHIIVGNTCRILHINHELQIADKIIHTRLLDLKIMDETAKNENKSNIGHTLSDIETTHEEPVKDSPRPRGP